MSALKPYRVIDADHITLEELETSLNKLAEQGYRLIAVLPDGEDTTASVIMELDPEVEARFELTPTGQQALNLSITLTQD